MEYGSRLTPVGLNARGLLVHSGHPLYAYGVICELTRDSRCLQMLFFGCARASISRAFGGNKAHLNHHFPAAQSAFTLKSRAFANSLALMHPLQHWLALRIRLNKLDTSI